MSIRGTVGFMRSRTLVRIAGHRSRLVAADSLAKAPAFEPDGSNLAAISEVRRLLREGRIVAIKGLGGFHLACDPMNDAAAEVLRERKKRSDKPFALMVPDIAAAEGIRQVCLSGGTFQNMYLLERTVSGLRTEGFEVYLHAKVPPNDGGIALGQAMIANAALKTFTRV